MRNYWIVFMLDNQHPNWGWDILDINDALNISIDQAQQQISKFKRESVTVELGRYEFHIAPVSLPQPK